MNKPHREGELQGKEGCEDLGHVLDYFPIKNYKRKRWLTVIAGVFAILIAIGLFIKLFVNLTNAIQRHGRAMILGTIPFPIAIYAIILVGGIVIVILAKIHWWDSITLFKNGLIQEKGLRNQVWYYENTDRFDNYVTQIKFGGSIISDKAKVILEHGTRRHLIILDNFIRMPDLIKSLRASILPGLFQRARRQLEAGQVLHFHNNLSSSTLGVKINQEVHPYQAVQAEIKNHIVKLHQKAYPRTLLFKSSITRIRNLDLLLDLLDNPPNPRN